jgi:hypothetical protein
MYKEKCVGVIKRKKKASKRYVVVTLPRQINDDDEPEYEEDENEDDDKNEDNNDNEDEDVNSKILFMKMYFVSV